MSKQQEKSCNNLRAIPAESMAVMLCSFALQKDMNNPRSQNGNLRRKHRARLRAMGLPCALCGQPIHYDEPSDAKHPLSFVIDEKLPVSRWKEFGYQSPEDAANDWNNLQPAHYICNQIKSNRVGNINISRALIVKKTIVPDGEW